MGSHSHFKYCMVIALDDTLVHKRKSSKKVVYWTTKMSHTHSCTYTEGILIFITQIDDWKFLRNRLRWLINQPSPNKKSNPQSKIKQRQDWRIENLCTKVMLVTCDNVHEYMAEIPQLLVQLTSVSTSLAYRALRAWDEEVFEPTHLLEVHPDTWNVHTNIVTHVFSQAH